jgi:hypothetical protein
MLSLESFPTRGAGGGEEVGSSRCAAQTSPCDRPRYANYVHRTAQTRTLAHTHRNNYHRLRIHDRPVGEDGSSSSASDGIAASEESESEAAHWLAGWAARPLY